MTSATRTVAVVATQLPTTDRRALSQAWFSALHLAQPPVTPPTSSAVLPGIPNAVADSRAGESATAQRAVVENPVFRRTAERGPVGAPTLVERRAPAGDLSRRMERAIERHLEHAPRRVSAVAVAAADGRVHVLVHTQGGTTRIIALCAPHLRERVDRALAHARFALAASGTHIEAAR
jgi:hypothetical protein